MARLVGIIALGAIWAGLGHASVADDWVADRLRGQVMVFEANQWVPISRGAVVSDSRRIKTLEGAHVVFVRDKESIELTGASEIRIFDKTGQRMTTVMQAYGSVTIDAEHLNVQHFSVQTPYLAAIVKGTKFTVTSNDGQTNVAVSRGMVQVQDRMHEVVTNVSQGLNATVSPSVVLDVEGGRKPAIVTMAGVMLTAGELDAMRATASGTETTATPTTTTSTVSTITTTSDDHGSSSNGNGNSGSSNSNSSSAGSNSGNGNSGGGSSNASSNSGSSNSNSGSNSGSNGSSSSSNSGHGNSGNGNGNSGHGKSGDDDNEDD